MQVDDGEENKVFVIAEDVHGERRWSDAKEEMGGVEVERGRLEGGIDNEI